MAITDKDNIGKKISIELSEYLKEYTSIKDRSKICEQNGVGDETLNRAIRRTKPASEKTLKAIEDLMRLAIEKSRNKRKELTKVERVFKKMIA